MSWQSSKAVYISLLGFAALLLYLVLHGFLQHSLWLDETISLWIISASFDQVIERTQTYQGQSPFYYLILFYWKSIFAANEFALRSLSVVLVVSCAGLLVLIAKQLGNIRIGIFALPFFVSLDSVQRAFCARPYALALFCYLVSFVFVLRWAKDSRLVNLLLAGVFALLTLYAHPLFIFGFLAHLYLIIRSVRALVGIQGMLLSLMLVAGIAPYLPQLSSLTLRANTLSFAAPLSWPGFLAGMLPLAYVLYLTSAAIFGFLPKGGGFYNPINLKLGLGLVIWGISGAVIFAVLTLLLGQSMFLERYFLWSTVGISLFAGWIISNLRSPTLSMTAALLLISVRESGRIWQIEGWREVAQAVSADTSPADTSPILLRTGLIETANSDWLRNPQNFEYLSAPLTVYSGNTIDRIVLLPRDLSDKNVKPYLDSVLNNLNSNVESYQLIDNYPASTNLNKLLEQANKDTFSLEAQARYGIISLKKFKKVKNLALSR